jgi:Ca-activated chloride channel family protein
MRPSVDVSTRFVKALNAHQVGLLVTIGANKPVERPPINVALVLDRSGSMAGEPLSAAKEAALRFAHHLSAADRLSVVLFDDNVATIYEPAPAGDDWVRPELPCHMACLSTIVVRSTIYCVFSPVLL